MPKFKTVITTVGAAKIAAVLAGTGSIVLDSNARMAVGDGNGTLPTPDPSQTALVKEVYRAALNTASIDASNPKNIIAELIIPPDKGGFWMREMALYDAAGTLLAVGNMAETYKPSLSEGAGRKQVIRMVIAVSDVTAVTITMDSSTVMATQDYVDSKLSDHEKSRKHPDATLTEKGFTQLSSETDSASEAKAATPKAVKTVMDAVTTKAPTDSPALTGAPTAPTAPADTNSTQLATTAFVVAALARLVNSSPAVLDTLGELAAALGNDPNFATTMTNALANKQPLDATLTALAGLANAADKLPYFTGQDQMATADLSAFIRTMLGKGDAAAVLQYLGLSDRLVFDISGTSIQSPNGRYTVFANDDGTWGAWDNVDKRQVPLDLTRGGFGGINAAEARTNLGLKAAAQRDVGTSVGQIPDMSSFGATKNGTGTFYLPNGIIVKWGTAQSTGTKGNAPYPTPFPNDTYAAIICHASASDSAHYTAGVMNPSRLGFDFSTAPQQTTGASFYYIAIGY